MMSPQINVQYKRSGKNNIINIPERTEAELFLESWYVYFTNKKAVMAQAKQLINSKNSTEFGPAIFIQKQKTSTRGVW